MKLQQHNPQEVKVMNRGYSRRELVQCIIVAGAMAPALKAMAKAVDPPDLTPLDPKDASARALGFVTDAVNAAATPNFQKGEHCGACAQFQGKSSDARAACTIFVGHSVPTTGWCQAWTPRSG